MKAISEGLMSVIRNNMKIVMGAVGGDGGRKEWWTKHGGLVLALSYPALVLEAEEFVVPGSIDVHQAAVMVAHALTSVMLTVEG